MQLNEKEATILACVEHRADLTTEQIAKETGMQSHTIRYHLNGLEDRGIIRRIPFINMALAGVSYFGVYFNVPSACSFTTQELIDHLIALPQISWLSELSGDYRYGLAIGATTLSDVHETIDHLNAKFCDLFFEKCVACQFEAVAYPRLYLSSKSFPNQPLRTVAKSPFVDLDDLDRKVLAALCHIEHRSRRQLSQELAMPLSTLDLRVKKLEEKQIIPRYIYAINAQEYGMHLHTILVFAKGMSTALQQRMHDFALRHPAIVYLYSCLGSWDFELNVEVTDSREVSAIVEQLNQEFGDALNTIKVLTKFRDLKLSPVPFATGLDL